MEECELCESPARLYCESDRASLCLECDAEVHGVNFLVARHSRTLLCGACQSRTPWTASGPSLNPTLSLCQGCLPGSTNGICNKQNEEDDDDEENTENDEDDDDEDDDDDDDDDGDDENQVVPRSFT